MNRLDRQYEVAVEPIGGGQRGEPFFVAAKISWQWDSLKTARTATTEEDMLMQVLGREASHSTETDQPRLRADVVLSAALPYGKPVPMPTQAAPAGWLEEAAGRLEMLRFTLFHRPWR